MQVLLKLFNMEKPATDGSRIPRSSVQEYLASSDYELIIKDHLALGGYTHKSRQVDHKYEDVISPDDQIVVDENITHYINKIFIKDDDPYCYAIIQVLDPDNYSGKRRDNILNLMADLKSGIMLPCSVVIQAKWDYSNVAESIVRIKGVDFTLGPAFEGSGTIKVFSKTTKEGEYDRTYSFMEPTKIVDMEGASVKELSLDEIGRKFGLNSEQYLTKKFASNVSSYRMVKKNQDENLTEQLDITSYLQKARDLLKDQFANSPEVLDDLIETHKGEIATTLQEVPGPIDEGKDEILSLKLNEFLRSVPKVAQFSSINSVRDRMVYGKYPRYSLINRIVKAYSMYYKGLSSPKDSDNQLIDKLFIQDLIILIRNVSNRVYKGTSLSTLYALSQFSNEVSKAGAEFSKVYRQVLISEKVMKFIPPKKYQDWKVALYNFINVMTNYTFGRDTTLNILEIDSLLK